MQEFNKVAIYFAEYIAQKQSCDSWFRYDSKTNKWFVYLKGHLTTYELFNYYLKTNINMDKKQNNEVVKINELRLGNSVFIDGEFADVNELIFKLILNKKIVANPIRISEDLLIDFGFKRKGSLWSHDKLDLKLYYCDEYKSYESEQLPMYVNLKYLHQLQNFYFMFKGVELKFQNVQ